MPSQLAIAWLDSPLFFLISDRLLLLTVNLMSDYILQYVKHLSSLIFQFVKSFYFPLEVHNL